MSDAATSREPQIDTSLIGGRYRIQRTLAQGGMGTVYCVLDERSGELLALKRMRRPDTRDMLALFEREYRTLAAIQHPRIIRVHDYGVDGGEPYYTMELVQGSDVHSLAPIAFKEACRYLRDVATCLALLHTRRLVHRDIAPRNVRVTPDGRCKLLDFGALTSFGIPDRLIGTPPCIPPEVLRGAPLDQRADLFSLGALAYFMLTGRHAYPARELRELASVWQKRLSPPSKYAPDIPKQLDRLVLGLLHLDPAARPSSTAEVVERLSVIASLPPEDEATQYALAESFFVHVQFVGRQQEFGSLREGLAALQSGQGSLVLIEGERAMGRTRLLSELLVQGQLLGILGVFVDASTHRQPHGTAISMIHQLLTAAPAALRAAQAHSTMLAQLEPSLAERLHVVAAAPDGALSGDWRARIQEVLHEILAAACRAEPLLIVIDNVDEADEASLALLAAMQRLTVESRLALVCSARWHDHDAAPASFSRRLLRERSRRIELQPLTARETFELARSVFGDAPDLARLAEWLHDRGAGRPLHCMELLRRLHARGVVRYLDGLWVLPLERPDAAVGGALDELLGQRLTTLSPPTYRLAEALAVQHSTLSRERCAGLASLESAKPFVLIEELLRADVLNESVHGFRFSHGSLRELLLSLMPKDRRRELHLRCAEQRLHDAHQTQTTLARIEAGWHFMHAGEESRGADLLAAVAYDTVGARFAFADLQVAAPALAAALTVYTTQARSLYERMPLLSALAQAGYYEARIWGERYGDEALAAVLEVSGVALGAKLQRFLGKTPGLLIGLLIGWLRFVATPRRLRRYPFRDILVQLFGVATTMTGMFASALDGKSAVRPARTLLPFAHLPERLTPVGIFQFCDALKEITRENEAYAIDIWSRLLVRFESSSGFYLALPPKARPPYIGGLWFARGVFESFRDGRGALHAADQLDRTGLKLYRMIGSQVRALYHANRGEMESARQQAQLVELHAIQIGTAAQIELWEPVAMMLVYGALDDLVEMRRTAERIASLAKAYPALGLYAEMSQIILDHLRYIPIGSNNPMSAELASRQLAEATLVRTQALISSVEPRSIIGWGAVCGYLAKGLNALGRHAEAEQVCTQALSHLTPQDRPFVALFLQLEIELAVAEAGLGSPQDARTRLDELLLFHAESDNPLTRGRLHEGYARAAALASDWSTFRHHLEETRSWYRGTGTPALLARVEALSGLEPWRSSLPPETLSGAVDTARSTYGATSRSSSTAEDATYDNETVVVAPRAAAGSATETVKPGPIRRKK